MKKKITLSIIAVALLGVGYGAGICQKPQGPKPHHKEISMREGVKKDQKQKANKKTCEKGNKELALMKNSEKNRKAHEKKLAEELNLTAEQKTQVKKIKEASKEKMTALMDEMKTLRSQMDELRKTHEDEFEKILTDEQKAELEKIKLEKKGPKPRPEHKGEPRGEEKCESRGEPRE